MMFTKHELETILYTLEGYMIGNDDDKLCDELSAICDKISKELPPIVINLPEGTNLTKVTITPQQLEGDISTVKDSDYADKVDTLVDKMGMREYKFDEQFYNEIVKDSTFSYGKFNEINYPLHLQQQ